VSNIERIRPLSQEADRRAAAIGAAGIEAIGGGTGAPPDPPDTWTGWRASVDARLARLEGALEGLRGSVDGFRWVVGIVAVVMIGGFSFLGFQLNRLEGRVDRIETAVAAIPAHLSEEFRAMRAEMAAQTSAIANSITAVRQAQPPPPQIIVIPAPQPGEKSPQPRP
jgi:hypothetical protein